MLTLDSSRARGHRRGTGPEAPWLLEAAAGSQCVCVYFFHYLLKPQFSSLQNGASYDFWLPFHHSSLSLRVTLF